MKINYYFKDATIKCFSHKNTVLQFEGSRLVCKKYADSVHIANK